uniref:C-type lectin domain-containing protein n=1 Tax=Terrapene triunguis TaxID=2587831 RepID=A0A674IZR5_9SAUR
CPVPKTSAWTEVSSNPGILFYDSLNVENEDSIQTSLSSFPTPEGSRCRLCPTEWLMHEGKCYWASKESRIWHKSHDDCSAKSSRLLVIQDQKEMVK